MRQSFQAFRYSFLGLCFLAIIIVVAGCTESLTPISIIENGNTTFQVTDADDGDASPVECLDWVAGLLPVEKAATGTFVTKWVAGGEKGPRGVAVDNEGNVYAVVIDSYNGGWAERHGVQKFDANGALLAQWDTSGNNYHPSGGMYGYNSHIALDHEGNVFVVDVVEEGRRPDTTLKYSMKKFNANGTLLTQWGIRPLTEGFGVDSAGNVYVADQDFTTTGGGSPDADLWHRIVKYDNNGAFLGKFTTLWDQRDGIFYPVGLAVDSTNTDNVYVADKDRHSIGRIMKFDANGKFLMTLLPPIVNGETPILSGVTTNLWGNVYAVDNGHNRIYKFDSNGKFVTWWGSKGSGDGQFNNPTGVAVDDFGNVYVADSGNSRIQKFCGGL